jgi:hypothetical protein
MTSSKHSIDEKCVIEEESLKVMKADFVEAFASFLYAGGHDVTLAQGDGLARAMRLKGFLQEPPGGGRGLMIRSLDRKSRGRGFFGVRLKTEEEMKAGEVKIQLSSI